ncbi:MAG: MFS transporter [Gammaproteobacteria bacterium]|jgi:MFS family permease|nr:hypothetical protein [Chromatiales bacterium]MDP6673716.1 MFS transporter [Gammaproteobacteria bacterium]
MFTLFLVIFVNVLGFGLIIPLLPFFVERLGGSPEMVTLIIAMYALVQFATAPWIGRLSDRFGRKPILIWTTAGTAVAHIVLGFADSLWLIILSRALAGVMAGEPGCRIRLYWRCRGQKGLRKGLWSSDNRFYAGLYIRSCTRWLARRR